MDQKEQQWQDQLILAACEFENSPFYKEKIRGQILFQTINRWLFLKVKGISVADYLRGLGYKTAAVYGMSELGNRLYEELTEAGMTVPFVMDQNPLAVTVRDKIKVLTPVCDEYPAVDIVIVTPVLSFAQIYSQISPKFKCPVVSFRDIIYKM